MIVLIQRASKPPWIERSLKSQAIFGFLPSFLLWINKTQLLLCRIGRCPQAGFKDQSYPFFFIFGKDVAILFIKNNNKNFYSIYSIYLFIYFIIEFKDQSYPFFIFGKDVAIFLIKNNNKNFYSIYSIYLFIYLFILLYNSRIKATPFLFYFWKRRCNFLHEE